MQARVTLHNGVRADFAYNRLGRLVYLAHKTSASALLAEFTYTLDAAGHRTKLVETIGGKGRTIDYAYDSLYRLTQEKVTAAHADLGGNYQVDYTFDRVGNRLNKSHNGTTTTYRYNERDQLLGERVGAAAEKTYAYDGNGSLTSISNGATYTYDLRKRLVAATVDGTTLNYIYDHDGGRVRKVVTGAGGSEERYVLDRQNRTGYEQVLEQWNGSGNLTRSFVLGRDVVAQTAETAC